MPNKFYNAIHHPTPILWQPVTETEVITTPDGSRVVLRPGQHVKITDLEDGGVWMNKPDEFIRRYKITDSEGRKAFRQHYPDVEVPE